MGAHCKYCGNHAYTGSHACVAIREIAELEQSLAKAKVAAATLRDQVAYMATQGTAAAALVSAARRVHPEEEPHG